MTKLLVETSGEFQFMDPSTGQVIRHQGYTLTENSSFLSERIAAGTVVLKGEVNDEATDADWIDCVKQSEGDLDLALEAFKTEFPKDGERQPKQGGSKSKHKETAAERAAREAAEKEAAEKEAAEKAAAEAAKNK